MLWTQVLTSILWVGLAFLSLLVFLHSCALQSHFGLVTWIASFSVACCSFHPEASPRPPLGIDSDTTTSKGCTGFILTLERLSLSGTICVCFVFLFGFSYPLALLPLIPWKCGTEPGNSRRWSISIFWKWQPERLQFLWLFWKKWLAVEFFWGRNKKPI